MFMSVLSLLAYIFFNYSSLMHSSRRLSYLILTISWWRGGVSTYPWIVLGLDMSVVHDVNHSRFSAPLFLEQQKN